MTQQPLNTHLFIQRLVHLVVSDPFESEATEQQVKTLAQQYARDKFARLPQNKRADKLRTIDAALHREVPTALYRKAHVIVEAALSAPPPATQPAKQQEAPRPAPPLPPREKTPFFGSFGKHPTVQNDGGAPAQEREQVLAAREAAVQEREDALQARENALQEREQILEGQAASLSTWEGELKALRDALAEAGGVV